MFRVRTPGSWDATDSAGSTATMRDVQKCTARNNPIAQNAGRTGQGSQSHDARADSPCEGGGWPLPFFSTARPATRRTLLGETTGSVRASRAGFEQLTAGNTSRASSDGSLGGVPSFQDGGLLTQSRIRQRRRTIRPHRAQGREASPQRGRQQGDHCRTGSCPRHRVDFALRGSAISALTCVSVSSGLSDLGSKSIARIRSI